MCWFITFIWTNDNNNTNDTILMLMILMVVTLMILILLLMILIPMMLMILIMMPMMLIIIKLFLFLYWFQQSNTHCFDMNSCNFSSVHKPWCQDGTRSCFREAADKSTADPRQLCILRVQSFRVSATWNYLDTPRTPSSWQCKVRWMMMVVEVAGLPIWGGPLLARLDGPPSEGLCGP